MVCTDTRRAPRDVRIYEHINIYTNDDSIYILNVQYMYDSPEDIFFKQKRKFEDNFNIVNILFAHYVL